MRTRCARWKINEGALELAIGSLTELEVYCFGGEIPVLTHFSWVMPRFIDQSNVLVLIIVSDIGHSLYSRYCA